MEIGDLLLTRGEVARASIWKDQDGNERIHLYSTEVEDRIAILASIKVVRAIGTELLKASPCEVNAIADRLNALVVELQTAFDRLVDKEFHYGSKSPGLGGKYV